MQELEKILEEIDCRAEKVRAIPTSEERGIELPDGEEIYHDGRIQGRYEELIWCKNIIRKHMNDG